MILASRHPSPHSLHAETCSALDETASASDEAGALGAIYISSSRRFFSDLRSRLGLGGLAYMCLREPSFKHCMTEASGPAFEGADIDIALWGVGIHCTQLLLVHHPRRGTGGNCWAVTCSGRASAVRT